MRAMPRPAPRVAPATTAICPSSGRVFDFIGFIGTRIDPLYPGYPGSTCFRSVSPLAAGGPDSIAFVTPISFLPGGGGRASGRGAAFGIKYTRSLVAPHLPVAPA